MTDTSTINKKEFRILHMYHDLMNLYGDWANAAALAYELKNRGYATEIDRRSVGQDMEFDKYDFIYIGSGTERSQVACMRDLERYKDAFLERIEAGVPVLATGNSHELFGRSITDCDNLKHEMLGLLDFKTEQYFKRVTGDCICVVKPPFSQDKLVGFINCAGGGQIGDISRPFSVKPGIGAGFKAHEEGIIYKNLLGTYLTGPLLVRNPPMMKYFADMLTGEVVTGGGAVINGAKREPGSAESESVDAFCMYQEKAYLAALDELKR